MKLAITALAAIALGAQGLLAGNFYAFGFSGGEPNSLSLDGGSTVLSTGTNLLGPTNNQGWWSPQAGNSDDNDNWIAGDYFGTQWNNFFSFSLAGVTGPASSAELVLGAFSLSNGPLTYTIFDVSTDVVTLNNNLGPDAGIYNDLGSGVSYGSVIISGQDPVVVKLNAAGLAALNAAIDAGDRYFSIGGSVNTVVPEPSSLALMGSALAAAALIARKRLS